MKILKRYLIGMVLGLSLAAAIEGIVMLYDGTDTALEGEIHRLWWGWQIPQLPQVDLEKFAREHPEIQPQHEKDSSNVSRGSDQPDRSPHGGSDSRLSAHGQARQAPDAGVRSVAQKEVSPSR